MFKKFAELVAGKAIKSIKPNVPKTKIEKKIRDLKLETQKLKGSGKKLSQTAFELKNKLPITFKKSTKKTESNREAYKRIQGENTKVLKGMIDDAFKDKKKKTKVFKAPENFNKGGRVGLKFGSKKSNVQKIKETFGPKKQLSAIQMKIAKLAGDPKKIDAQDLAKLRGRG